ncbi:LysM peptidoglycan-binding domain-containing M23 family metallopeptidase [Streptomyces sp. LP05-1]|uniref:LysM peptidoglycan-binding domain-containing M23 family metallopeptidase n=1 Tax=Streptomyces pyxinae TaxID=2970734 RepID=A0ABT2CKT9_9ACTN|nr:LysM peptidoglycan-binding domain-containing M23 family metallopeptidase [Streptomyces sp. LP05-1]MCS0638034.1 LysM peptidoglycan-binding domain-containing M23 family metallopeptidase [Streptomyces sp. LP05-1]
MPAKGKHRRPKSNPLARGVLAAGTGGAALALPLLGATGAHAAANGAPAAASEQAATAAVRTAAPAPRVYTVVSGDHLAKIAHNKNVKGGWQRLYQDNRQVIGDDPGLILPGMKLTLGGGAAKAERPQTDEQRSSRSADRAEAPAPAKESAEPAKAAEPAAPSPASDTGFTAPVDAAITTPYHASGSMWSSGYHTGVDFAAATGTSVKAAGSGTVVSAGWGGAYGNQVVIRHEDGNYTQYGHLSSLSVSAGQTVSGGQQIGLSGATGNASGPHLHFEVRTGPDYGSDIDPVAWLRQHGVSA